MGTTKTQETTDTESTDKQVKARRYFLTNTSYFHDFITSDSILIACM